MTKYYESCKIAHHITSHHIYYYLLPRVKKTSRFIFAILQGVIDALLYYTCFEAIIFFTKQSQNFTSEVLIFLTGTMLACFLFTKLYGFRNWTLWEETSAILKSVLLILLLSTLYLYANKFHVSFLAILLGNFFFIPVIITARYFFRSILFRAGLLAKSIIILGAGEAGKLIAKSIQSSTFTARKILCFLDDDDDKQNKFIQGVQVLGKIKDFESIQSQLNADEAVIAIPTASRVKLADVLNDIEQHIDRVLFVPDMYMLTTYSAKIRSIDGMPVISSSQGLLNPVNVVIKTIIDYIGAVIALIFFTPVMLWAAYRIKKEDGGPIFYNRERVGWKGKNFITYKFRTMHTNAEEITKKLFKDPEVFASYKQGIKLKDDPRVTKIGAFLRKTSIDELPQIFNIFKGEMSLVGPRPLIKSDVDLVYSDDLTVKKVYTAKPGLTGIWQVSGRSDLDAEFRRKINCYYVHNWSVWLDIAILFKTPLAVLSSKGAY
ncbi:MAG: sugar transferase [Synergistaceae bacterium]|nr:sugar transferase [Synergistaceae bacterium]